MVETSAMTVKNDPPDWLKEQLTGSLRSVALSIAFVGFTLIVAIIAEWLISKIPAQFVWAFGGSTLQVRTGVGLFFAWDLAAILSMILYFIFYWGRMFAKDGPMSSGGTNIPPVGRAMALLTFGLLFAFIAFLAGLAFTLSMPHSMEI